MKGKREIQLISKIKEEKLAIHSAMRKYIRVLKVKYGGKKWSTLTPNSV